jgi:hypothetical protein
MRVIAMLGLLALFGCGRNVDWIKERAPARWAELGYHIVGYEGYSWSLMGGDVWYALKRTDSPGVLYTGFLRKWGGELHMYNVSTISGNQFNLTGEEK